MRFHRHRAAVINYGWVSETFIMNCLHVGCGYRFDLVLTVRKLLEFQYAGRRQRYRFEETEGQCGVLQKSDIVLILSRYISANELACLL
jgi:hypothetical protein